MTNAEHPWRDCPTGELSRLGSRLRGRRRRRFAARAGGAVAAVLLAGIGLWSLNSGPRDYTFAGITCTRVIELAMAYKEGGLEPAVRDQVRSHVEQCPRCHPRFKEMGLVRRLVPERWQRAGGVAFHPAHDRHHHSHPPSQG